MEEQIDFTYEGKTHGSTNEIETLHIYGIDLLHQQKEQYSTILDPDTNFNFFIWK